MYKNVAAVERNKIIIRVIDLEVDIYMDSLRWCLLLRNYPLVF